MKLSDEMDDATLEELAAVAPASNVQAIAARTPSRLRRRPSAPMLVKKSAIIESARQKRKKSKTERKYSKFVNQLNPPYKVYE